MTREEAIDVLKHNYPSACFTDLCEAVEIAIQALSAQPEQIARDIATIIENEQDMRVMLKNAEHTEPHWIPCSERLPEDDTLMLVNYIDHRPDAMDIWIGWHEMENVWYIDGEAHSEEYGNEVIAWMPLPEPWKEGESDE